MENLQLIISGDLDKKISERQVTSSFMIGKTVQRYESEHSFNPINFDISERAERELLKAQSIQKLANMQEAQSQKLNFQETFEAAMNDRNSSPRFKLKLVIQGLNDIQDIRTTTNIGRFANFINPESKVDVLDGINFSAPKSIMDTIYPLQNRGPAPDLELNNYGSSKLETRNLSITLDSVDSDLDKDQTAGKNSSFKNQLN